MTDERKIKLCWKKGSGKGWIVLGEYDSATAADNAIPEIEKELLAECKSTEERSDVLFGDFRIERPASDG